MIGIGITGSSGRMGRALLRTVLQSGSAELVGGSEEAGHEAIGQDLGTLAGLPPIGRCLGGDDAALFSAADVVIDFTSPSATARHARLAAEHAAALVCGTTGLDATQRAALRDAAAAVPVVYAANMSVGINLLIGLTAQAARVLPAAFDAEIVEMHHRLKVDAPSGTALALGEAVAKGREIDLDAAAVRTRDGHTGPRREGAIGFATLRGGDVVGEHTVVFAGAGERIELTHRATSREVFAAGALRAALWLAGRRPGLYGMADVLGFTSLD